MKNILTLLRDVPTKLHPRAHAVLSLARALPAFGLLAWPSAALAAPVVVVPAGARTEAAARTVEGDGLCAQFAAAQAAGTLSSSALASALLDQTPGAPAQAAPSGVNNGITSFFGIAPLLDYGNDTPTSSGGFAYDLLFPWSRSAGGEICQSHQPVTPVVRSSFAARYTGLVNIRSAGTKTFAIASDDGYALRIGALTVAEFQGNRDAAVDTRRASFAQPGVYPFELIFWSSAGAALLEIAMADGDVVFLANNRVTPDVTGALGNDLTSAAAGSFADALGFRVLGDGRNERGILFLADADKTAARCGPSLGAPNDVCSLADVARLCGNGVVDARASGAAERCDDGNETSNDGCSSTCQIEDGYLCGGVPSACSLDPGAGGAGGAAGAAGEAGAGGAATGGAAGAAGAATGGAAGASGAATGGAAGTAGEAGAGGDAGNGGGGAGGFEAAGAGGDASGGTGGLGGIAGSGVGGASGAGGLAGMASSGAGGLAGAGAGGLAGVAGTTGLGGAGAGNAGTAGASGSTGDAGMGGSVSGAGAAGAAGMAIAGAGGQTAGMGGLSGVAGASGVGATGGRAGAGAGGAAVAGRGGEAGSGGTVDPAIGSDTEGGCAIDGRAGSGSRSGAAAAFLLGVTALLRRRRRA